MSAWARQEKYKTQAHPERPCAATAVARRIPGSGGGCGWMYGVQHSTTREGTLDGPSGRQQDRRGMQDVPEPRVVSAHFEKSPPFFEILSEMRRLSATRYASRRPLCKGAELAPITL